MATPIYVETRRRSAAPVLRNVPWWQWLTTAVVAVTLCIGSAAVLRIGSIVLRVDDLRRQTEFWQAALGYLRRDDGESDDFVLLGPPDAVGPHLSLDQVRSSLEIPPRLHLDLYTDDQAREVERLIALGATEVHWDKRPPDADYVILADPEGNRFCVVETAR
jgi:catechol 2,3-dioxygenase-like lactoylglutathione lyase family enzyme